MTKDLTKWVLASINSYFNDNKGSLGIFYEGQIRDTDEQANFIEIRTEGPYLSELDRGNFRIYIEINILIQTVIDKSDLYKHAKNCGLIVEAFKDIPVYKFGDNDSEQIGCLTLIKPTQIGAGDTVKLVNFGQVNTVDRLMQSSVEGHYNMHLREI